MWLYLYLAVVSELVNTSLFQVFLLVAICKNLRWLVDFTTTGKARYLSVLGFSPFHHRFVLLSCD